MNDNPSASSHRYAWILLWLLAITLPLLTLNSLWMPVWNRYAQVPIHLNNTQLETARLSPSPALAKLADSLEFGALPTDLSKDPQTIIAIADKILAGRIEISGLPPQNFTPPFDARLITAGNSNWQLPYAGFVVPRVLLLAYKHSHKDRYLNAAIDFALGWKDFEDSQWIPTGFTWNDHAIASRAVVLADLWHHFRKHSSYDEKVANQLLQLVDGTAQLLERESLYTFKTNHGSMQSLALMKLGLYFKSLPGFKNHLQTARNRLIEQGGYLINSEGVFLEHSAGYQLFDLKFFNSFLALNDFDKQVTPDELQKRINNGRRFSQNLRRPDNTLPGYGDTNLWGAGKLAIASSHSSETPPTSAIYPQAGYAIVWSNPVQHSPSKKPSQTVVSWSNYPYMGHKHADDAGINIWQNGHSLISAIGYWPYSDKRRELAISWQGSNAPHWLKEPNKEQRTNKLIRYLINTDLQLIDIARIEANGFTLRRQVIIRDKDWLILDFIDDPKNRHLRTVWNSGHGVVLSPQTNTTNDWRLTAKDGSQWAMQFLTSSAHQLKHYRGSEQPLIGWLSNDNEIRANDALVLSQPALTDQSKNSRWSVLQIASTALATPPIHAMNGEADAWQLEFDDGSRLIRNGDQLQWQTKAKSNQQWQLLSIADAQQDQGDSKPAYLQAAKRYQHSHDDLIEYRSKLSWVLAILALLNWGLLILWQGFIHRWSLGLALIWLGGWGIIAYWANFIYLVV